MRVRLRPDAASDIENAYRWYRSRQPSLGIEFLRAVQTAIVANPEAYPVLHRDTRRIRLRRFPYGVFYRVYPEAIVVVACMHGRRDPRRWQSLKNDRG